MERVPTYKVVEPVPDVKDVRSMGYQNIIGLELVTINSNVELALTYIILELLP